MTDTNQYQSKLQDDLNRLTEELKTIGVNNPMTDDWLETLGEYNHSEADTNSEADANEELDERRATLNSLETEYRDVKRALKKIEEGTFGICEISGEVIEEARLQFKPTARTCIKHMNDENQLPI